jgi:hypothetical protein
MKVRDNMLKLLGVVAEKIPSREALRWELGFIAEPVDHVDPNLENLDELEPYDEMGTPIENNASLSWTALHDGFTLRELIEMARCTQNEFESFWLQKVVVAVYRRRLKYRFLSHLPLEERKLLFNDLDSYLPIDEAELKHRLTQREPAFSFWVKKTFSEIETKAKNEVDGIAVRDPEDSQQSGTGEKTNAINGTNGWLERKEKIKKAVNEGYKILHSMTKRIGYHQKVAGDMVRKYFPEIPEFVGKSKYGKPILNVEFKKLRKNILTLIRQKLYPKRKKKESVP